jgi:hypothetical protein
MVHAAKTPNNVVARFDVSNSPTPPKKEIPA